MIDPNIRFGGFDSASWGNLLALLSPARPRATLVVLEGHDGSPLCAFDTRRGAVALGDYRARDALGDLAARHGAERALAMRHDSLRQLSDRAAVLLQRQQPDYLTQWLSLLALGRELARDGAFYLWPERRGVPVPSATVVRRALDVLLPAGTALVIALWEGESLWTALSLRRGPTGIDRVAGPQHIGAWAGPMGGDWRRDHRAVVEGVSRHLAPLHLGLFSERAAFERLLRTPAPGAWAAAVALREIIIRPAPPYVGVAVGGDAVRAAAGRAADVLGGFDVYRLLEPLARYARSHVGPIDSVSGLLGFNPLEALARRLSRTEPDGDD